MKSPTVSCTSKVPTRRVSFTSTDSGSTGKSAADSGSSSLQDSSPSKEPTSNRKAIVPPPPHRISNGDMGDGKLASQCHVSRLQPYTPPSPLAMAGRSGPAEESCVRPHDHAGAQSCEVPTMTQVRATTVNRPDGKEN